MWHTYMYGRYTHCPVLKCLVCDDTGYEKRGHLEHNSFKYTERKAHSLSFKLMTQNRLSKPELCIYEISKMYTCIAIYNA